MIKSYFKKLALIFFYVAVCFSIYFIGYGALKTLSNFFEAPIIRYGILFGIPAFIILMIIYKHRIEKHEFRRSYLKSIGRERLTLKKELLYLLKFDDFLAETYSFATIIFPFVIAIAIGSQAPWYADILAGIIVFSVILGLFASLDFLFWMIVHTKWRKDCNT